MWKLNRCQVSLYLFTIQKFEPGTVKKTNIKIIFKASTVLARLQSAVEFHELQECAHVRLKITSTLCVQQHHVRHSFLFIVICFFKILRNQRKLKINPKLVISGDCSLTSLSQGNSHYSEEKKIKENSQEFPLFNFNRFAYQRNIQ